MDLDWAFQELPLVAILRGIEPAEIIPVAGALIEAGFRLLEIPLNSPAPFDSIRRAVDAYGDVAVIGAGTVLSSEDARQVDAIGGRLVVAPNLDLAVGETAKAAGLYWLPGIATPTEAFAAIAAGADAIKIFPAEMIGAAGVKAMRAVLPAHARVIPVGGITPDAMAPYVEAGANGFGLGSALYRPGVALSATLEHATSFVKTARTLFAANQSGGTD